MINGKISGKQVTHAMVLFLLGSSLVTGGSMIAKQDSWMSVLIGMVMALPVVIIYGSLNKLAPGQDIFDMAYSAFGKIVGAIITALFSLYAIVLGALVIKNFTEYFQVVSIPETPQLVVALCLGILICYNIIKGFEIVGRGSAFVMQIVLTVILFISLFSVKYMSFDNVKPILYQNWQPIFTGAFSVFAFPFGEAVLFITVFSIVDTKKHPAKLYVLATIFSGILLCALVTIGIMAVGLPVVESMYFPSYAVAGIVDVGNFVSRIEVLVSGNYIIFGVAKVCVCLFVSCKGIAKLFGVENHKVFALPIQAIMVAISVLVFESTMQMFAVIAVYKVYSMFFQIAIPLALLVVLKIKSKKQSLG